MEIRDMLQRETKEFEQSEERGVETKLHRSRYRAKDAAQVYSVRIPVHRLQQLRRAAEEAGTTPSNLIRMWIVERLDQPDQVERFREVVAEELDRRHLSAMGG